MNRHARVVRKAAERRRRLIKDLGDGLLLLPTAAESLRNGDVQYPFRADSDFRYLTAFEEPDAVLLVWRVRGRSSERLYVRPRDKAKEIWDGRRHGVAGAKKLFGFADARPIADLWHDVGELLHDVVMPAGGALFHGLGRSPEFDRKVLHACTHASRRRRRAGVAAHPPIIDPRPSIAAMRQIKDALEIDAMRDAARVSAEAHCEAMRFARAGLTEYEVQAALEKVFRAGGSPRNGYESICASGANACILHYIENRRSLRKGELMLIDAGAEFDGYTADITRTFPVDGTFTDAQRAVYAVVLRAQKKALRAIRPGRPVTAPHTTAVRELTKGLVELGVLRKKRGASVAESARAYIDSESYRPFYMHGTSHWLGMDVHDCGPYTDLSSKPVAFESGMVLTVEPGLYFDTRDPKVPRELRGIGVRIEDDALVTKDGVDVLTADVPKEIADVEAMCRSMPTGPGSLDSRGLP